MKINIFKDTIEIKKASSIRQMILFIISLHPGISFGDAYKAAVTKVNEVQWYKFNQSNETKGK